MKKSVFLFLLIILSTCSKPDPYDQVREVRRKYDLSIDLTTNQEQVASYEIKVQNNAGDRALQEITVLVQLMDGERNVLWSSRQELDISSLGHYASDSFTFKENVGEPADKYELYDVVLAPDDADSDFKGYREFKRVAQ